MDPNFSNRRAGPWSWLENREIKFAIPKEKLGFFSANQIVINKKIRISMIRLYHKNRYRFLDPRGSWLKIFEKPIGCVERIQVKTENKEPFAGKINLTNKSEFMAPNYSLHPLMESGVNSGNLSVDSTRHFLELKSLSSKKEVIYLGKLTCNLSDSHMEKISRTEIGNQARIASTLV